MPERAIELIKHLQPSTQVVVIDGPHGLLQAAPSAGAQVIREFLGVVAH